MKKLVTVSLISTLSALLIVGCTGTPKSHDNHVISGDSKSIDYTPIENELSIEKLHKKIISAGEESGWKITEFKSNALLAEKFSDGDAKAVTIHFSKDFFHIDPKNSELHAILEKALNTHKEE